MAMIPSIPLMMSQVISPTAIEEYVKRNLSQITELFLVSAHLCSHLRVGKFCSLQIK